MSVALKATQEPRARALEGRRVSSKLFKKVPRLRCRSCWEKRKRTTSAPMRSHWFGLLTVQWFFIKSKLKKSIGGSGPETWHALLPKGVRDQCGCRRSCRLCSLTHTPFLCPTTCRTPKGWCPLGSIALNQWGNEFWFTVVRHIFLVFAPKISFCWRFFGHFDWQ